MRSTHARAAWRGAAAAVVAGLAAACGAPQEPPLRPAYDSRTGRLETLAYDGNHNGIAEAVGHLEGSRIVRVEVDVDEDGRTDRWEYYGAGQQLEKVGFSRTGDGRENAWSYADPDGRVVRIEIAGGADPARITRTEHFHDEAIVRAEEDTDADGRVDKWETYRKGRLASLAFGDGAGVPVRALLYEEDGSVRFEEAGEAPAAAIP